MANQVLLSTTQEHPFLFLVETSLPYSRFSFKLFLQKLPPGVAGDF